MTIQGPDSNQNAHIQPADQYDIETRQVDVVDHELTSDIAVDGDNDQAVAAPRDPSLMKIEGDIESLSRQVRVAENAGIDVSALSQAAVSETRAPEQIAPLTTAGAGAVTEASQAAPSDNGAGAQLLAQLHTTPSAGAVANADGAATQAAFIDKLSQLDVPTLTADAVDSAQATQDLSAAATQTPPTGPDVVTLATAQDLSAARQALDPSALQVAQQAVDSLPPTDFAALEQELVAFEKELTGILAGNDGENDVEAGDDSDSTARTTAQTQGEAASANSNISAGAGSTYGTKINLEGAKRSLAGAIGAQGVEAGTTEAVESAGASAAQVDAPIAAAAAVPVAEVRATQEASVQSVEGLSAQVNDSTLTVDERLAAAEQLLNDAQDFLDDFLGE